MTWPPCQERGSRSTQSKGWQRGQRRWQGVVGTGGPEGMGTWLQLLKKNQKTAPSHVSSPPQDFWGFNPIPEPGRPFPPSRWPTPSSAPSLPFSIRRRPHPPRGPTLAKTHKTQNNEREALRGRLITRPRATAQGGQEARLVLFIVFTRRFVPPAVKAVKKDDRVRGQEHRHRHAKARSDERFGSGAAACFPVSQQTVVFPFHFTHSLSILYLTCLNKVQPSPQTIKGREYGK